MNDSLREELEQFKREKDQIREIVGQIGGKVSAKQDKTITIGFTSLLVVLFIIDTLRHTLHLTIPFPPLFSVEIGLLSVSIKIIWMLHRQTKVEHFQFWILNSIEYRVNDVSNRIKKIEKAINNKPV